MSRAISAALAAPILLSLLAIVAYCVADASQANAWAELLDTPGLVRSIAMSVWTGLAATIISWGLSAWLLSKALTKSWWSRLMQHLSPMLAVPHAAFAVGFVFLVAPSGLLFRAVSPWLTSWSQPPLIASSQDALGLGFITVLVLKEVPFLLFCAATQLQRDDVGRRLAQEAIAAQTLGYSTNRAFWTIVWPQLSNRLAWPLLAVLAYSLTVVDTALIAAPSTPATLSVRAWQWLQDSDSATNALGSAAAWVLMLLVTAAALGIWAKQKFSASRFVAHFKDQTGQRGHDSQGFEAEVLGPVTWSLVTATYFVVLLTLALSSVAGVWPFPDLVVTNFSVQAWMSVGTTGLRSVLITIALGLGSSLLALAWVVSWLELAPRSWDEALRKLLYLPLILPGVLWVVGMHRMMLAGSITGSALGLLIAHFLAVLPYSLIALSPAYQGFDARYRHACSSLGKSRWTFLIRIKWPLLRQSLWSAFAIGFAVSLAQFLPTLYIGEGRFTTITTEAVTLSSGGQRSLVAAFAWLQWLLPVLVFALATWGGKPRQFSRHSSEMVR